MFRNEHGIQPRQSFEDILLSDSLSDFNAVPSTSLTTEFDLDLDQLTTSSLGIPDSDWDVMAQSDNVLNPMLDPNHMKSGHMSFLQLSPPAIQFDTLPDTKFSVIPNEPSPVHNNAVRSPSFFQSGGFHQQQVPVVSLQPALYRTEQQAGVVKAKLVSSDYSQGKSLSHYDVTAVAAAAANTTIVPTIAPNDQEQQDHIVNSLSVSQMLAVASAYDHVCQIEDLDVGCANWLAMTPDASELDIRAVRALFNPDRWNFAKDIVMRIVKIVDDLRSAVSEVPGPSNKAAKHAIGRTKKRVSPKLLFNPMNFATDLQMMDEHGKKRRI